MHRRREDFWHVELAIIRLEPLVWHVRLTGGQRLLDQVSGWCMNFWGTDADRAFDFCR